MMELGRKEKLFFVSILVFSSAFEAVRGDAMVTGTVFCDQCKDGERSWFDYPLYGVKVKVSCTDGNGQTLVSREETTNWFGSYAVRFDGAPDLGGCYAQVSGLEQASGSGCVASAGPAQQLRLMYRMFDTEMYVVDSLLAQPSQPMSNCPTRPTNPVLAPGNPLPVTPTSPSPPAGFRLPPMPQLPPMPPMPFVEATACSHDNWTRAEYRCYWRGVNPDTKVSLIFGASASRRYGPDMTMLTGLQGRGDLYRTLLREAITSFLNSYNTLSFPYHTLGVVQHTDRALTASSPQTVLLTALRFKRANSGSYGNDVTCKFTPCK